jgi:hypothetical protein
MSTADDHARQLLVTRRALLQAKLRRAGESRRFRALARTLHEHGVRRFSRLPPARARALLVPFADWPARDERFWWPGIGAGTCVAWDGAEARDDALRRALQACFAPGERLAFVFHTAESCLVIGCAEAVRVADLLLRDGDETLWVVGLRPAAALVEVSFIDHEVCWVVAPASAVR